MAVKRQCKVYVISTFVVVHKQWWCLISKLLTGPVTWRTNTSLCWFAPQNYMSHIGIRTGGLNLLIS